MQALHLVLNFYCNDYSFFTRFALLAKYTYCRLESNNDSEDNTQSYLDSTIAL